MKRFFKYVLTAFFILLLLGAVGVFFINEPLPVGVEGEKAEMLTDRMFEALNKKAFDSIRYIEFSFRGVHTHQWNRAEKTVIVMWDDQKVKLDLTQGTGQYSDLERIAYEYFINDSFWLVAPFKARDEGVRRSYVELEESSQSGLLVSYTSGGVTPGDSYLWMLDDQGFPVAWKLWTSNVPIGGLTFTWEDWSDQGAKFSTFHKSKILELEISNLRVSY